MAPFRPQPGERFQRGTCLLAGAAAIYLVGCGDSGEQDKLASNGSSSRDAGAIAVRLDAAFIPLPMADAAVVRASVDGGMSGNDPAPVVVPDPTCTVGSATLYPRPAEVMLVLDRSTAMADALAVDGTTKWAAAASGINSAVAASQGTTAWGLVLFPKPSGDTNCCQMPADGLETVAVAEVAPELRSAQTIAVTLAESVPTGVGNPTAQAIIQTANFLRSRTTSTSKYVVLATAAEPTCASDGLCSGASTLDYTRTKDAVAHVASVLDIPVAVAGIALPSASNGYQPNGKVQLFTDLANLGGLANAAKGQPPYYAVASAADLASALGTLGTRMTSCSFALPGPVAWPDNVAVLLSGNRIPQDPSHQDGWDFADTGTSVVLYGKPCDESRQVAGGASLSFVTACPAVAIN